MLAISGLIFLFCIGLYYLSNLVSERRAYQESFLADISQSQISRQSIVSPYIRVPYQQKNDCVNQKGKADTCITKKWFYLGAESTSWETTLNVTNDAYKRSMYRAISYNSDMNAIGVFNKNQLPKYDYKWDEAEIVFPVHDSRGLNAKPTILIKNTTYEFNFTKDTKDKTGFDFMVVNATQHPELIDAIQQGFKFNVKLNINGLSKLTLIPTSDEFKYSANGNWEDVKYDGQILPFNKKSNNQKFIAQWNNLAIGQNNLSRLSSCTNTDCFRSLSSESLYTNFDYESEKFGISAEFLDSVNIYSQTDRALKYGVMIILITFASFFLFEILKGLRIHPMQYTLVAFAQGIFFLLLLAISEYYYFVFAYLLAATACVTLISWYLFFIMKGFKSALLFGTIMSALYVVVYFLLQSSGKTFLIGSIISFCLLACIMYLTRHIDWYRLNQPNDHITPR